VFVCGRENKKKEEYEMGGTRVQRLSGIQKQVLSLYRGFLRVARSKSEEERRNIESVVKKEFRRNSIEVDRKNFQFIEYLLRRGNKQLDQLRNPGTIGLSSLQIHFSK
jgi:succinate dehydrogenase assembly factor 1